jgi:protein involved in polysaccharide export with SLBB domain
MKVMKLLRCVCQGTAILLPQLLLGLLLVGCGSIQGYDPINPKKPFTFPGQPPSAPTGMQPSGTGMPPAPDDNPISRLGGSQFPVSPSPYATKPGMPMEMGGTNMGAFTVLRAGDTITLSFSDLPPNNPMVPVRVELDKDGKIGLPYNVNVFAVGKSIRQLEQEVRSEYVPKYYKYLTVSVQPEMRFFHVSGEVKMPGVFPWRGQETVLRGISTAGGLTDWAKKRKLQLVRADGQQYIINFSDAEEDAKKDLPIFPGDYIYVPRKNFLGF